MNKSKYVFVTLIAFLLFITNTSAEGITVNYSSVVKGASGGTTQKSGYCYTNGCRNTSIFGLNVSILKCDGVDKNNLSQNCAFTKSYTLKYVNAVTLGTVLFVTNMSIRGGKYILKRNFNGKNR